MTQMTPPSEPSGIAPLPEGPSCFVGGDRMMLRTIRLGAGGAYALFEGRIAPGGGLPPHLHRYEDETLIAVDGAFRLVVGDEARELRPGDRAFAPRGTIHAFTNIGHTVGRLLVLVTPGDLHERFLAEVGLPVVDPDQPPSCSLDLTRFATVAAKYGIEFPPSPGA